MTDARTLNAWRRWGYRVLPGDLYSYILHMRPAEWPSKSRPMVVATGGLAGLVAPLCKEIESVHPDLTLVGLRIAAAALGLKW